MNCGASWNLLEPDEFELPRGVVVGEAEVCNGVVVEDADCAWAAESEALTKRDRRGTETVLALVEDQKSLWEEEEAAVVAALIGVHAFRILNEPSKGARTEPPLPPPAALDRRTRRSGVVPLLQGQHVC